MAAQDDDLLGAESLRGNDAAQTDGAVADDGHFFPGLTLAADGGVMACAHHVGERQQRRHQRVVFADRQDEERAVRQGIRASLRPVPPSTPSLPKNPPWTQRSAVLHGRSRRCRRNRRTA